MGVKQTVLSIVIVALAALTTPSSAAAQQCSVPDPATFDFQPLITKWFPNPALYVLQQGMDGRAPKIVPSGQTVSNSQYETGTVVLENKLQDIAPERRTLDRLSICSDIAHNGSGYVFGVQHLFEAHVSSDAGHDPHLTPFEVLFKDSAAPDHHVIAVPAPTGSSLFCENRPSEEDDPSLFSCPDQIRLVALKRFYSQLLATWTQEFEEQLTQLHATQATYQAQQAAEENEEKSENRRAAQRHNAHAADLLAGRVPIKSCNDAAIKYKAQQGEKALLTGELDKQTYYGFANYLVGDHAQRGDSQAVLIQIGAYAAIMVMGPDSIDKEPAMQLPVCAVGRFLGFETLKNGRRVATFQGAYLGR